MRVAIVGEPTGWHVRRLAGALGHRGHAVAVVRWMELAADVSAAGERFAPAALDEADRVVVRGMPGAGAPGARLEEVVFRMDALARLEARGTRVVNAPKALEAAIDKYLSLARLATAGVDVPRTVVVQGAAAARAAWTDLGGDCVVKPLFGSRGRGVERITDAAGLEAWLAARGDATVGYLQEFIPHGGRDVRVLLVGERTFAMNRTAPPGEWRTNVSLGGTPGRCRPPEAWMDAARRVAVELGAEVVGVDLAAGGDGRPVVLEANAVPGWRGLEEGLGEDVTAAVADHLENRSPRA